MVDDITFVVIGKNESSNLPRCFNSLKKISGNIIFVDSDSSDNSIEIAINHNIPTILRVKSPNGTPSLSRSIGAKYVKTDYVHFVDGDMEINIDWANKALTKLQSNNRIAAVHGFKKVYTKNYKDYFILSDTEDWEADYLQGAFLINREIYNRVGGLDSRLYGEEERDLYIRIKSIGYEVWYLHQLMGSHYDLKLKTMKRSFFSNLQAMIWIPFIKSVKNNIIGSYIFVYRLALVSLLLDFISIFFVMIGTVTGIVIAILFQFIELLYSIMINRKGYFIIWKVALLNIFRVYKIWNQETTYSIERIK